MRYVFDLRRETPAALAAAKLAAKDLDLAVESGFLVAPGDWLPEDVAVARRRFIEAMEPHWGVMAKEKAEARAEGALARKIREISSRPPSPEAAALYAEVQRLREEPGVSGLDVHLAAPGEERERLRALWMERQKRIGEVLSAAMAADERLKEIEAL